MAANIYQLPVSLRIFINWQKLLGLFWSLRKEDNVISVVYKLFREYRIKVTLSSIVEYLKPHRDYPSLKSICDFFNEMGILNFSIRIDERELYDLKRPFLAHLNISTGRIILVYSVSKEYIIYSDSFYGKKVIFTRPFLEKWDGVVILIEPSKSSGEIDYKHRKATEIISNSLVPISILIFCFVIFCGNLRNIIQPGSKDIILVVLLMTHTLGFLFSLLLLRNELNIKTKFSEKLCHLSTSMDCDAVTKSNISTLFGNITWADIGITWFAGGLILSSALQGQNSLNILPILSLISLPFPLFSILYQKFVIKKWCPLCLFVQAILIGECILLFRHLNFNSLNFNNITFSIIVFSTLFLVELLIKQNLLTRKEKDHIKIEFLKIKRDPAIFISKLKFGERIILPDIESTLTIGSLKNKITITIFLSFYCSACARQFPEILRLLSAKIDAKIQLVFYQPKDDLGMKMFGVINKLLANGNIKDALDKIAKWYNSDLQSRIKLTDSIQVNSVQVSTDDLIKRSSLLFKTGEITSVPTVLINGYPLPKMYALDDIKYYFEDIEMLVFETSRIEV